MSPEEGKEVIIEFNKIKSERDTLIDDLSWYKAKVSRLERENKDLRLQSDSYFEQWQNEKLTSQGLREQCKEYAQDASKFLNLLSEFSQHIGNKPSSSTYKYFRAKLDGIGIKEGD
ncbi:hypothetical protein QI313_02430 [Staphylococcus saprophyticus]|nr:hypothetical protein [Staphylococcus saprophyticus]